MTRNIDIQAGIHNRFDIEVIDVSTGAVRQRARAENVVCDGFWTTRASRQDEITWNIVFGSGSGTPAATDSALFSYVGGKDIRASKAYTFENGVGRMTVNTTLLETEYVGTTLREVGLAYSNNLLFSHAMLQDMNGNPISIEKTDTDVINIYATWYVHCKDELSGIVHLEQYYRAGRCGLFTWLCGAQNAWYRVSGNSLPCTSINVYREEPPLYEYLAENSYAKYDFAATMNAISKTLTLTGRLGVSDANLDGGIKYISFRCVVGSGGRDDLFTNIVLPVGAFPGLEGYSVTADSIGTGDGSETAFQAHFDVARDFVLKVNGTAVSNYTRDGRDITLSAAPEIGAVVTADYFTDTIPKDSDHVYDLTVTISFGEYTPE